MHPSFFAAALAFALCAPRPAAALEHEGSTPDISRLGWGRGSAIELLSRGARAEARGDPYGALRAYAEAVQLDPTFGRAQLAYGRLRERLHDLREAEYLYGLATRSSDAAAEAFAARARVRKELGRDAEALLDLERAATLAPDEQHVETLATWYAERGAWPQALAVFRRLSTSIDVSPGSATGNAIALRIRALTILAAECDPVSHGKGEANWVRRALARVALRGSTAL